MAVTSKMQKLPVTILASVIAIVLSAATVWLVNTLSNIMNEEPWRTDRIVISALYPFLMLIFDSKQRDITRILAASGFAVLYSLAGFLF
ncbi:MAG: hypothetical protein EA392_09710 [Cryomorphaceae bacterium]|nr:MAG: hypothetical protein EA392_09710 [Cryomorphaceae bacterium]